MDDEKNIFYIYNFNNTCDFFKRGCGCRKNCSVNRSRLRRLRRFTQDKYYPERNQRRKKYQFGDKNLLTVTFDDKITALDTIINKLEKGGNKINGKPVYVK